MAIINYKRVSSIGQNVSRQLDSVSCDKEFIDYCSGGSTTRPELTNMIDYMRSGDQVNVHSIDRLARNLQDLLGLVELFKSKGVILIFVKENMTFDFADNAIQNLMLSIMGSVAQFEKSMILERQKEGIAKAKEKGIYKGRKPKLCISKINGLLEQGMNNTEIAKELGVTYRSITRIIAKNRTDS